MQETTKQLIKNALDLDVTAHQYERETIICVLDEKPIPNAPKPLDRILSRSQVAACFGCSVQMVDWYARHGYLKRASITGKQAIGFRESEIRKALDRGELMSKDWTEENKKRRISIAKRRRRTRNESTRKANRG